MQKIEAMTPRLLVKRKIPEPRLKFGPRKSVKDIEDSKSRIDLCTPAGVMKFLVQKNRGSSHLTASLGIQASN